MNTSYHMIVDEGGSHDHGVVAELRNLAQMIGYDPPAEEVEAAQQRLVSLARIVHAQARRPSITDIETARRILRQARGPGGRMPAEVDTVLRLLGG
jgi:hypothetical protein